MITIFDQPAVPLCLTMQALHADINHISVNSVGVPMKLRPHHILQMPATEFESQCAKWGLGLPVSLTLSRLFMTFLGECGVMSFPLSLEGAASTQLTARSLLWSL